MEQKQKHNQNQRPDKTCFQCSFLTRVAGSHTSTAFPGCWKKTKQKKTLHECIRGPNNTRRSQTMHVSLPLRHSATVKNNAIKRKRPSDCICLSLPAGLLLPFFAFLTWHEWYFQTCSAVSCAYAKIPNTECIRQSLQCNTNRPIHQGFFAR